MTSTTISQDQLRVNLIKEELVSRIAEHAQELLTMAAKSEKLRDKARLSGKAHGMLRVLATDEDAIEDFITVDDAELFAFALKVSAREEQNDAVRFGMEYIADAIDGYLK
jgi:hypothetical protein